MDMTALDLVAQAHLAEDADHDNAFLRVLGTTDPMLWTRGQCGRAAVETCIRDHPDDVDAAMVVAETNRWITRHNDAGGVRLPKAYGLMSAQRITLKRFYARRDAQTA